MEGCGSPEVECGPVPCHGFLVKACCPCIRHPDCDIGDDDNDGDPYCPALCLTGHIEAPLGQDWDNGVGGTTIDARPDEEPQDPPGPGPVNPSPNPSTPAVNPLNPSPTPQCACEMEMFPVVTGTEYGGSFGDPQNCRRITAVWKQECKGHGTVGPPPPPTSHSQLFLDHKDDPGFRHNSFEMRQECRDVNARSTEAGCTDPYNKCVPIVMSWLECLEEEEDDGGGFVKDGGGGGRWQCIDTGETRYCKHIDTHVPGIVTYPSKASCEAFCSQSQPPVLTPLTDPTLPPGNMGEDPGGEVDFTTQGDAEQDRERNEPLTPDNLGMTDYSLDPYDDLYNLRITNSSLFTESATLGASTGGLDPYNIFKPIISRVLQTMLVAQGNSSFVPYNGTTISGFIYNRNIVINSLEDQTRNLIYKLNRSNMMALNLTQMMFRALKTAVYKNTYQEYTPQLLEDMISSVSMLKVPLPQLHNQAYPVTNRAVGLERARKSRYSMYAKNHPRSGDMQRQVQMYYMPPPDYDLKVPVYTREGTITGVRIGNDSKVKVIARSSKDGTIPGYEVGVAEVNDYLKIRKRGGDVGVALKSHRSKAMAFNLPDLSLIQGYLKSANHGSTDDLKYSFKLDVSTTASDNIEVSGRNTLAGAYLVQLDNTSMVDVPNESINLRSTTCNYNLIWQEYDSPKLFEMGVSAHSGPRNTVYINADDPWWMHFQKTKKIVATYTDLDIDGLDGYLYPRRINTDMLLIPVTKVKYNILQGDSTLVKYDTEGTVRSLGVTVSPLKEVYAKTYVAPVKKEGGLSWGNKHDSWAIRYAKNFDVEQTQLEVIGNTDKRLSQRSMLGDALSVITDINDSYNLQTDTGVSGLPKVDLFSFFTVDEMVEFIYTIPADIRQNLFAGVYNGIKLFDIKISDTEKSYITSRRLKFKKESLESLRKYITVPPLDSTYFPDKYEGILFKYASRT